LIVFLGRKGGEAISILFMGIVREGLIKNKCKFERESETRVEGLEIKFKGEGITYKIILNSLQKHDSTYINVILYVKSTRKKASRWKKNLNFF
jgi:hypothetical protein